LEKELIMRIRPVGPGVGGLNYSPLLRDTNARIASPAHPEVIGGATRGLWAAIATAAQRAGQRIRAARMAQAEALIAQVSRQCALGSRPLGRRDIGARYY
jgi:hypothetical protein